MISLNVFRSLSKEIWPKNFVSNELVNFSIQWTMLSFRKKKNENNNRVREFEYYNALVLPVVHCFLISLPMTGFASVTFLSYHALSKTSQRNKYSSNNNHLNQCPFGKFQIQWNLRIPDGPGTDPTVRFSQVSGFQRVGQLQTNISEHFACMHPRMLTCI